MKNCEEAGRAMFWENKIIREDLEEIYSRNIDWEKLKGKTIFITGAYGMLASYLVFQCIYLNEIVHYGMKLVLAVRSEEKARKRFGDFLDKEYMVLYLEDINEPIHYDGRVDYIIHGASLASTQYYDTIPIEVMLPNILGTIQLLRFAEKKDAEGFLLFSSGEVYGAMDSSVNVITEDCLGTRLNLSLRNCYGESKKMAETLCYVWFKQKNVPTKMARIGHTYGPTMDIVNDKRVFSAFVNDVIHNRNILVKSDGSPSRQFCYIADATAGFFMILLEGNAGEVYNLFNMEEFLSVGQLAKKLAGIYPNKNLKVERIMENGQKILMGTEDSKPNPKRKIISSEKMKTLGWRCKYDTKDGFYRTIEAIMQENRI